MISANLPRIPTFDDWRGAARNMLAIAAKPDEVVWRTEGETDLFASAPTPNLQPATPIFVPRAFIDIAGKAALHSDPHRFALLYCCLLYTSPSPRDRTRSRMPSSA